MAFLKDVESEEMRELVKSCFKEINSLKEQLSEENKDIKTNEAVQNVLIQNENQNSNLTARINELTEEVNKKEKAAARMNVQQPLYMVKMLIAFSREYYSSLTTWIATHPGPPWVVNTGVRGRISSAAAGKASVSWAWAASARPAAAECTT